MSEMSVLDPPPGTVGLAKLNSRRAHSSPLKRHWPETVQHDSACKTTSLLTSLQVCDAVYDTALGVRSTVADNLAIENELRL